MLPDRLSSGVVTRWTPGYRPVNIDMCDARVNGIGTTTWVINTESDASLSRWGVREGWPSRVAPSASQRSVSREMKMMGGFFPVVGSGRQLASTTVVSISVSVTARRCR